MQTQKAPEAKMPFYFVAALADNPPDDQKHTRTPFGRVGIHELIRWPTERAGQGKCTQ